MKRNFGLAWVFVVNLAVAGCGGGSADTTDKPTEKAGASAAASETPPPTAKQGFDSPQQVVDAMRDAMNSKNGAAVLGCIHPDARDRFVGSLVVQAKAVAAIQALREKMKALRAGRGAPDPPASDLQDESIAARVAQLFQKHGIGQIAEVAPNTHQPAGEQQSPTALAQQIADKPAFVGEILGVLATLAPSSQLMPDNVRLKDLKIEGDTAQGFVSEGQGGKSGRPTEFKRSDGRWYVDYSDEATQLPAAK